MGTWCQVPGGRLPVTRSPVFLKFRPALVTATELPYTLTLCACAMIFCWFLSLLLVQRAQLGQAGNSFLGILIRKIFLLIPSANTNTEIQIHKYKCANTNTEIQMQIIINIISSISSSSLHPFLLVILVVDVWEGSLLWVTLNLKKRFSNFLLIKLNRFELVCHFGTKIFSFELRKVLVPTPVTQTLVALI